MAEWGWEDCTKETAFANSVNNGQENTRVVVYFHHVLCIYETQVKYAENLENKMWLLVID